jgi:hypothetical protein
MFNMLPNSMFVHTRSCQLALGMAVALVPCWKDIWNNTTFAIKNSNAHLKTSGLITLGA